VAVTRQFRLVLGSAAALAVTVVSLRLLLPPESRHEFLASVRAADWRLLAAALLLNPVVQFFRAWRFGLFLERREGPPGLPLFRISVLLLFFNYLLPLRMGEATFPILVKREYGTGMTTSIGFLALTRVLDLVAVVLAGGVAGFLVLGSGTALGRLSGLAVVGAACILAAVIVLARLSARAAHRMLSGWPRVERFTGRLLEGLHLLGEPRRYAIFLGLTAAVWLAQYVVCLLVLSAVAPGSGFGRAVIAGSAGMLSFALPVNGVAGIGPMQAAWAWALAQVGVGWATGVASGLLLHGVFLLGAVTVAGIVALVSVRDRSVPAPGDTTP
jgi:hypothetical protein